MDINNLKSLLFEKAIEKGFSSCELYYEDATSFNVSVYKGNIEKYQNSQTGGFCFRGIYNDYMGYYFSECLDDIDVDFVVSSALANAEILSGNDKEFIFEGSKEYAEICTYSEDIHNLTVEDKINFALNMEKSALEYDKRIEPERTVVVTGENYTYIANTKGLELSNKSNFIIANTAVIATDKGETKNKNELFLGTSLDGFDPVVIGKKAAEKTILSLGSSSVESGKKKVVIKNDVFADILSCFCNNFFAENVQKGFSLLNGKQGEKIASEDITIVDNPHLEGGYSTIAFDSEGVATYCKKVVDKGLLKTFLYNLKTAYKDGVSSTGNGFKGSFKSAVNTCTTNFYIENGNMPFDEILKKVGDGIYINDVAGLHSGASAVSGDFSFAAEGFLIENGKLTKPVNQITIADNFYNIINKVEYIADDLKFNSSAIGSPSIAFYDVSVSGL